MIDNEFLHKVVFREYKPWDSDTAVRMLLPERDLDIWALGFGDPEMWARENPVNTAQWVHLSVHWNSFCVPTAKQEKAIDGFNAAGFCKALTTDRDGSTLVIIESIVDLVLDDEVMGDQINTAQIGDWYKVTNNSGPLLIVESANEEEEGVQNSVSG